MSNSALASLTAQYTDSENEEEQSPDSQNSQASVVIIPKPATPVPSPAKTDAAAVSTTAAAEEPPKKRAKKKQSKKSVRRLVSYQDDTIISDEEADKITASESSSSSDMDDDEETNSATEEENEKPIENKTFDEKLLKKPTNTETPMDIDEPNSNAAADKTANSPNAKKAEKASKYAHYNFNLPAEPKGKPSVDLVEKIRNLHSKMETNNMDMNRIIQERKEFRNPSIYEKLIQFCDINEFGTNYPPEIYDPLQWGPESYYEELAKVQKADMLRRQKERKDNDKIEQATVLARKVEEEAKKRKSKWDQPAKPVVSAPLTTTVTGTKGTVISAFGSLPKKPAI